MIKGCLLLGVEDISEAYAIREEVFVREQGFSLENEKDEKDRFATHAILYNDDVPCATGRLYYDEGAWHIGRIAVLKEMRGKKLGDLLVRMLLDRALAFGAQSVYVGSQEHAIGFYEKMTFERAGDMYLDEGAPHYPMVTTRERMENILFAGCGGDCANCPNACPGGESK